MMFEILKMAQCLQDPKRKIRVKTFLLTLILNDNIAILSLSCIYVHFVSSAVVKEILFALLTSYIYNSINSPNDCFLLILLFDSRNGKKQSNQYILRFCCIKSQYR